MASPLSAAGPPGGSPLGRLVADSAALKTRLERLTAQSSDGRAARVYGDLGPEARRAVDLRGEVARREAAGETVGRALGRVSEAQVALDGLSDIARDFVARSFSVGAGRTRENELIAGLARSTLAQVGALLNERGAGGEYLFANADAANPPLAAGGDLAGTAMYADVQAAVAGLGGTGAAAALAATLAATGPGAGYGDVFSATLDDPANAARRTSLADDGGGLAAALPTGLWADRNADAGSAGAGTTGSWSRDLLRGLMTLAALPSAAGAPPDEVEALVAGVRASFASAADALGAESGALGLTESRLEAARTRHAEVGVALQAQLAAIEEVDLAATLTAMQEARTRLEASWRALGTLSGMSLADYLR